MKYPDFIDDEMRVLMDTMKEAIVPASKRKPAERTNFHVPYYLRGRTVRL